MPGHDECPVRRKLEDFGQCRMLADQRRSLGVDPKPPFGLRASGRSTLGQCVAPVC
jgi:hypothetical protein